MTTQNLLEPHGLNEKTARNGPREANAPQISRNSVQSEYDPAEQRARWQKHVTEALWIILGVVIVLGGGLLWAQYHGLFESANPVKSAAPWPVGWP